MNAIQELHAVRLCRPFYGSGAGIQVHRYLDADFIPRFQRDLQRFQLDSANALAWRQSDRFSDHDDHLVLRLPIHKCFYLVSCEVVCDRLGRPALGPERIDSAGFVIRHRGKSGNSEELSWMLEDDQPLGWEPTPTGLRDPDVHRRMCRDGSLHPRELVPTYTGEQTFPLHPQLVTDEQGKKRTILYGYLPLGGSYLSHRQHGSDIFDPGSLEHFAQVAAGHLPWPYGFRAPLNKQWKVRFARPVSNGIPSREFFELLRLLLNRYHLGEESVVENGDLQNLTENMFFYDQAAAPANLAPENFNDSSSADYGNWRKYSLWSWLQYHFSRDENRLVEWLARQEKFIDDQGGLSDSTVFEKLPSRSSNGTLDYALYHTAGDAQDFRNLLDQRVLDQALVSAGDMPLPKFQQGEKDLYQIIPFVRVEDKRGRLRIVWGDTDTRSDLFRVAAPFDPHASRPSLIQMPSLRDIRKGMARGVSMVTPADTFNIVNALKLKKGASEDVLPSQEPGGVGIQWICSFSLPAITLVAMILLMIMISLLNIVFFWMAWIKICLPFPKIK